jgi:MFS family permease
MGGWLGDRYGKKDIRWNLWIIAIIWFSVAPFNVALYLSGDPVWALGLFIVPAFAGAAYLAPILSMTQSLVTLRMRSVASAILLFILNIIGLGLGPQTVGFLSDALHPEFGEESLRYALLITSFVGLWGALHFVLGARTLKEDIERARVYGQV